MKKKNSKDVHEVKIPRKLFLELCYYHIGKIRTNDKMNWRIEDGLAEALNAISD